MLTELRLLCSPFLPGAAKTGTLVSKAVLWQNRGSRQFKESNALGIRDTLTHVEFVTQAVQPLRLDTCHAGI